MILKIKVPEDFPVKKLAALALREGGDYKLKWVDEGSISKDDLADTSLGEHSEAGEQKQGEDDQA